MYSPFFFPSKCSLFHNSNVFGSCIIHILYTGRAKIKKKNSGAKRLKEVYMLHCGSAIAFVGVVCLLDTGFEKYPFQNVAPFMLLETDVSVGSTNFILSAAVP